MGKKQDTLNKVIQFYKQKLSSDQRWTERAIVVLYDHQTQEEKAVQETHETNGVGFSGTDAKTLSYYATLIKNNNHLTGKYLEKAFRLVPKYARQLIRITDPAKIEELANRLSNNQ